MLRRGMLLVVLTLVAVGVVTWVQHDRREQEWAHGGDGVTVHAEVGTASQAAFPDVLAALGGPGGDVAPRTPQTVVAHVTWDGSSDPGTYAFVLLDARLAQPRPLRGYGAWWPGDPAGTGPHWDGRYEALGEHYPWLARTASTSDGPQDPDALGVPAAEGEATLAYYFDRGELPTAEPARDLVLAMAFVGADGEVRWARKVPLSVG